MIQLYIILLTGLIFNNSYKSSHEIEQNLKPNFIVVFVDEIDAYFIIDKKNLPLEFRLGTSKKIQAINIPSNSKIKRFMIGWD